MTTKRYNQSNVAILQDKRLNSQFLIINTPKKERNNYTTKRCKSILTICNLHRILFRL